MGDAFYIIVRGSVVTTCSNPGADASGAASPTAGSGSGGSGGGGGRERKETVIELSVLEKNDFFGASLLSINTYRYPGGGDATQQLEIYLTRCCVISEW